MMLRFVEMGTGCILHVIHVVGTRMKRAGIYGLYQGDLLEGMMTSKKLLDCIPLNELADERSGGRIVSWINSWWKDRTVSAWGGSALKRLSPDDWFELHTQEITRLWTHTQSAMETVVEVFNEYHLEHPHTPHVFAITCLMTHLWRSQLSKGADVLFTIDVGPSFWP